MTEHYVVTGIPSYGNKKERRMDVSIPFNTLKDAQHFLEDKLFMVPVIWNMRIETRYIRGN